MKIKSVFVLLLVSFMFVGCTNEEYALATGVAVGTTAVLLIGNSNYNGYYGGGYYGGRYYNRGYYHGGRYYTSNRNNYYRRYGKRNAYNNYNNYNHNYKRSKGSVNRRGNTRSSRNRHSRNRHSGNRHSSRR